MSIFEELSPIYSRIVSETVAVAPSDWSRLWIDSSCAEGTWSTGGYWERRDVDDVIFFQVPYIAGRQIYEAWKISKSYNDQWSTALFRVDRPDKLQITFGHEDMDDESYDPSETQADFRAKTFGSRRIDDSSIDMSGAVSLTPQMLQAGSIGPQA